MSALPLFKDPNVSFTLLQTKWKASLDPILANPILSGVQLNNVSLINGTTTFPHLLGRRQQGWFITDINGAASIFRPVTFNDKTLTLTSSAVVIVNLWVY